MTTDPINIETAHRLVALIDSNRLSPDDAEMGHRCVRRLTQPLRMLILASDANYALSLAKLLVGHPLDTPPTNRLRVMFLQSSRPLASVEFSDGYTREIPSQRFHEIFDDDPARVRVGLDLPALKKMSVMVAADGDAAVLAKDVEDTLLASDITVFVGGDASEPLIDLWSELPDWLKDHSYLALSPEADAAPWTGIADEFADVLTVDPELALAAKAAPGGVDKEAFKAAGGTTLVKAMKRELDVMPQAAMDAAEVLLARFPMDHTQVAVPASPAPASTDEAAASVHASPVPKERQPLGSHASGSAKAAAKSGEAHGPVVEDGGQSVSRRPGRPPPEPEIAPERRATGERVQSGERSESTSKPVMPKRVRSRAVSKRTRRGATPWSLDL